MGWVLLKLGRLDQAEPHFEKAWERSKDHEIAAHYGELLGFSVDNKMRAKFGIWAMNPIQKVTRFATQYNG